MATVKKAMDRASRQCSVRTPADWISTTQDTYLELKDFLEETIEDVLDRVDLPSPIGDEQTIAGDGSTTYNLDASLKRIMRDSWAVFETTDTRRRCVPVQMDGQWAYLNEVGTAGAYRYYRTAGDEEAGYTIDFYRALESGDEVKVQYVSKYWLLSSSVESDTWSNAADTLLLPRRLIELGVIWRYRRRKGLGYADVNGEYETKISRMINDARNTRSIYFGSQVEDQHPMRVPVPDIIPSS